MRYAYDGSLEKNKIEAKKGLLGLCPLCGTKLIAKCGEINIHHWSHINNDECEINYNPMSQWHKDWQNIFDINHREVVIYRETKKKISDAIIEYNDKKYVLEFQCSNISVEEISQREEHFNTMIWIFKEGVIGSKKLEKITRPIIIDDGLNLKLITFDGYITLNKNKTIKIMQQYPVNFIKNIILKAKEKKKFSDFFDELEKNNII